MNTFIQLKALNQRPIAFYPIYASGMGSLAGGILLSQLMYWFGKSDKFYKTDAEMMGETSLTAKQLKNAKQAIKKLSFIKITREGVPAKTYYEIDWDAYAKELEEWYLEMSDEGQSSLAERDKLDGPKGTNLMGQKGPTITETTTDTTTENKVAHKECDENKKSALYEKNTKAIEIAHYLATKLSESIETYKYPTEARILSWAKDIDKAMRLDGRTEQQLKAVIDWIHEGNGSFWIPNIKSGKKLREQFDTLWFQMSESERKHRSTNIKEEILAAYGKDEPFLTVKIGDSKVRLCLYGEPPKLYNYNTGEELPYDTAEKMWEVIFKNRDKILRRDK